jgi:hypothetical protein
MKFRYIGCYETSDGKAVLTLSVRRWFRWRTEHWARIQPKGIMTCEMCERAAHGWWFNLDNGKRLSCTKDSVLSALYGVRSAMPGLLPDNVVPLHRSGVYR